MALEKLRAALAAQKSAEKSTQLIPLARAEPQENINIFEINNLGIFEEIPFRSANIFKNQQPLLTYASRKSEKNSRN